MGGIDHVLDGLERHMDDSSFAATAAAAPSADVDWLARLARILGLVGGRSVTPTASDVVDIASTGGPGSLSTLIAPLYARALGARVSKIGVPGRPAGGIDVLGSLPGYETQRSADSARRVLDACGYLHVAAGVEFCPLDARFFSWRQHYGAQAVPNLAIASLLAKKVAAGVGRFVLDVRVGPHGNFGATLPEAREHARRLIAVAEQLGIVAVCVLEKSAGVAQPWIGRGEALVALAKVFRRGELGSLLRDHVNRCFIMATLAVGLDESVATSASLELAGLHEDMLAAHGADPRVFWTRQEAVASAERRPIVAESLGILAVDLATIREVLVGRQREMPPVLGTSYPDPCGLVLTVAPGVRVKEGTVIAQVRDTDNPLQLVDGLRAGFTVTREPDRRDGPEMEVIRG